MANRYFVGYTNANWSVANNWSAASGGAGGASVPGAADIAIFDNNSPNCTLDVGPSVLGVDLQATFAFTLDLNDWDFSVGTSDYIQAGGTVSAGAGTLSCSADFNLTAGTFNRETSTLKFHLATSKTLTAVGVTFYKILVDTNASSSVTLGSDITVSNEIRIDVGGSWRGDYDIFIQGDIVTNADGWSSQTNASHGTPRRPTLVYDAAGDQHISSVASTNKVLSIHLKKPAGTLIIDNDVSLGGDWVFESGNSANWGTNRCTVPSGYRIITDAVTDFYNVTIDGGTYTITRAGLWKVTNDLTVTAIGNYGTGDIEVGGNISSADTGVSGGDVKLVGTVNQQIDGPGMFPGVEIDKPSGDVIFGSSFGCNSTGFINTSGSTITPNGYTITMKGTGPSVDTNGQDLHSLEYSLTYNFSNCTIVGSLTLSGNLIMTKGRLVGTINVEGSVSATVDQTGGTGSFNLTGTGTQTVDVGSATLLPAGNIEIDKISGTVILLSAINQPAWAGDLDVRQGVLDLSGFDLVTNGALILRKDAELKLTGAEAITPASKTFVDGWTARYASTGTALLDYLTQAYSNLWIGASKRHEVTAGPGNGISVSGIFGSDGTSGTRAILRSTVDGTQWEMDLQGGSWLDASVDVKDGDASAGNNIYVIGSLDSGNNTAEWIFYIKRAKRTRVFDKTMAEVS